MTFKKKSGSISDEERKYIIENRLTKTVNEIANHLKKNTKVIEKEIKNYISLPQAVNDSARWHLKHTLEWKHLRQEFTAEELNLIEDKYVKYVEQMQEDITATEEAQLLNMIKVEILMSRNLKGRIKVLDSVRTYEAAKDHILNQVEGNWALLNEEQRNQIMDYQDKITAANNVENSRNDEYNQLQNQLNKLSAELKTSRAQRVDKIADARFSFISYVKELLERDKQEQESRMLELLGMSTIQETKRLGSAHQYADGNYDYPIFSAQILSSHDKEDSISSSQLTDSLKDVSVNE